MSKNSNKKEPSEKLVMISLRVQPWVRDALKAEATSLGMGYQTRSRMLLTQHATKLRANSKPTAASN